MPELVRLYIRDIAIGFVLGIVFTGLLLWLNVGNLWHLVRATEEGPVAVLLLVVFNTMAFASVQFAIEITGIAHDDDHDTGLHVPQTDELPVAVESGGNRSDRTGVNFPRA